MFNRIIKLTVKFFFACCLLLMLLLPLVSFRLGITTMIFPALEIVIIYYYTVYLQLKAWQLFIAGIFFDQLYYMPLGTNSLTFLTTNLLVNLLGRWWFLRANLINFVIFCGYSFLIIYFRCLIVFLKSEGKVYLLAMIFQYLTTIFSYPLLKVLFNKAVDYLGRLDAK